MGLRYHLLRMLSNETRLLALDQILRLAQTLHQACGRALRINFSKREASPKLTQQWGSFDVQYSPAASTFSG